MKVIMIELMNRMAKGERPKFKFRGKTYEYVKKYKEYDPVFPGVWAIYEILDEEVEVIEETNKLEDLEKEIELLKIKNKSLREQLTLEECLTLIRKI